MSGIQNPEQMGQFIDRIVIMGLATGLIRDTDVHQALAVCGLVIGIQLCMSDPELVRIVHDWLSDYSGTSPEQATAWADQGAKELREELGIDV